MSKLSNALREQFNETGQLLFIPDEEEEQDEATDLEEAIVSVRTLRYFIESGAVGPDCELVVRGNPGIVRLLREPHCTE